MWQYLRVNKYTTVFYFFNSRHILSNEQLAISETSEIPINAFDRFSNESTSSLYTITGSQQSRGKQARKESVSDQASNSMSLSSETSARKFARKGGLAEYATVQNINEIY